MWLVFDLRVSVLSPSYFTHPRLTLICMNTHARAHTHVRLAHTRRSGKNQAQGAWLEGVEAASWLEVKA